MNEQAIIRHSQSTPYRAPVILCFLFLAGSCAQRIRKPSFEGNVARLKRDLAKATFAMRTTKTLIARSSGAPYLPQLYNRLAELYVEQASYHYQISAERSKNTSGGVVSVQARLLKNQAIATYRRLLSLYPNYTNADRVVFYMGHEMRELGEYEDMLRTYQRLVDNYPKSEFRLEALLVMGDHYFDKSDLNRAESFYAKVTLSPESPIHAMARYKLAWCKVNRGKSKEALALFNGSIQAAKKFLGDRGARSGRGSRIDLRREALVDSVFSFTEVHPPKLALSYFKARADSKTTYLAALDKLGNRYYVKQDWAAVATVYREILSLAANGEDSIEYAHRLYEAVSTSKNFVQAHKDVKALIGVIRRRIYDDSLDTVKRRKLYQSFEKYIRYLATQLQDRANQIKSPQTYKNAAAAYRAYLGLFAKSQYVPAIRGNLADVLYAAKDFLDAGYYYELAAKKQKGTEREKTIHAAVSAYFEGLKDTEKKPQKYPRITLLRAHTGLRRAGLNYIRDFPKAKHVKEVKFNIARTYYDEGAFETAIRLFTDLSFTYPRSQEGPIAAHLALDAYRRMEDFQGLISAGRSFAKFKDLGDTTFKNEVAKIVRGAEENLLRSETVRAGGSEGVDTTKLEAIADKFKGTELGKKALLNAFVTAQNSGDPAKIFAVGERFQKAYPKSEEVPNLLATMGKAAVNSLDFRRGVSYLKRAAEKMDNEKAVSLYEAVGRISVGVGNTNAAEQALRALLRLRSTASAIWPIANEVAQLYRESKNWNALVAIVREIEEHRKLTPELMGLKAIALFHLQKGVMAAPILQRTISLAKERQTESDSDAAASAQFYLAEIAFQRFEKADLGQDLQSLGDRLRVKLALISQARQAYSSVGQFGNAKWTVAALGRLSAIDRSAAASLRQITLPGGLPEDATQALKNALDGHASPLDEEAKSALKQCKKAATRLVVLSAIARACLAGEVPSLRAEQTQRVVVPDERDPEGAEQLRKIIAKNPRNSETIKRLGQLYLKANNPYIARLIFDKAIEIKEGAALLNLSAIANARIGMVQEALEILERGAKRDPGYARIHLNRALLLKRYGYVEQARRARKKAGNLADIPAADVGLLDGAAPSLGQVP